MMPKKWWLTFLVAATITLVTAWGIHVSMHGTAPSDQNTSQAGDSDAATTPSPEELLEMEAEIIRQTNEYRVSLGLNELTQDDQLTYVARIRAQEIVTTWSHIRPDGTKYVDILVEMQYPSPLVGENLARYQDSVSQVMEMWIASPSHQANLVGDFNKIGTAVYLSEEGQLHYVQIFAQ
ncbi:MAG: CAP domain-containing protein [Lachnospiraceae bacterium]|nr:CAP domain-containing protein [Lachnospiraceae bacterium]